MINFDQNWHSDLVWEAEFLISVRPELVELPNGGDIATSPTHTGCSTQTVASRTGEWVDLILLECENRKQNIHLPCDKFPESSSGDSGH
jgi:hypothetical protein